MIETAHKLIISWGMMAGAWCRGSIKLSIEHPGPGEPGSEHHFCCWWYWFWARKPKIESKHGWLVLILFLHSSWWWLCLEQNMHVILFLLELTTGGANCCLSCGTAGCLGRVWRRCWWHLIVRISHNEDWNTDNAIRSDKNDCFEITIISYNSSEKNWKVCMCLIVVSVESVMI